MNPTEKLALVASCTNCNRSKPIYQWEMFRKGETETEFSQNDTITLKKFALTDIDIDQNLVIGPKALSVGEYISSWYKPTGQYGLYHANCLVVALDIGNCTILYHPSLTLQLGKGRFTSLLAVTMLSQALGPKKALDEQWPDTVLKTFFPFFVFASDS